MANSSLKEKTASGLFWAALNSGCMQILNALIGIFLARLLLPADYGLVGMLAIFSAVATTLQESGFTSALTNMEKPTHNDYNSVFWFCNIFAVILYALLFFCAPLIADFFHQEELITLSRVAFLSIPLSAIGIVPTAYLFKNLIIKEVTIQRIIVLTISGIVGIVMAFKGLAYWSLVAQQLTYCGLQSLGKYLLMPWRPSLHVDFGPVRRMFAFSSKILVTNVVGQVSNNILTVIFGRLFPVRTVGNFTQAYKWNNMASSTVSGMMQQVAQPVLASIKNENGRQLNIVRKMVRFTAFLAFPAMFGLAIISKEFLTLLISDKWIDSVPILQILCVSGAFLPLYQPLQNLIVSHGRSDLFMWFNIAQIVIQITLILFFSSYGVLVMVAVYSGFIAFWTVAWQLLCYRIIGYTTKHFILDIAPFMLAAAVSTGVAYVVAGVSDNMVAQLAIKVMVAAILYYVIMKLSRAQIMEECINFILKKRAKK